MLKRWIVTKMRKQKKNGKSAEKFTKIIKLFENVLKDET